MNRNNVDQRFPEEGDSPGPGKSEEKGAKKILKRAPQKDERGKDPDTDPESGRRPRRQLVTKPVIIKPGERREKPYLQSPDRVGRTSSWRAPREGYSNRDHYARAPRSAAPGSPQGGYERPPRYHREAGAGGPARFEPGRGRSQEGYHQQGNRDYPQQERGRYPNKRPEKNAFRAPRKLFTPPPHPEGIRINRYIANAGICSRRDADKLVEAGDISINGKVVTTLGTRIDPGDVVAYKGVPIQGEKLRYILLNKPKGYITTLDDPEGRITVMELITDACRERLFPVGRLDMNTTGLLLFTNDGLLAEKLMHPRNVVKKLYHIKLDKPLTQEHIRKISLGIRLEDGWIKADQISWVGGVDDKTEIGMEIHSGKNRIVRRIFESLSYDVHKLDRVMFAGLTKKDLRRGKWRHLSIEEVNYLKML